MSKRNEFLHPDAPLLNVGHRRPRTRREFIGQGLALGTGTVIANSMLGLFPSAAHALSNDFAAQLTNCAAASGGGGGMVPFLCFDLAGGANIAGSNVLIGAKTGAVNATGSQLNLLSTAGYSMLGLPASMVPNPALHTPGTATGFIDDSLGLAFHADSAFLRGINMTCSPAAKAKVSGAVIPARSENDTGNNPHNPMYGIYRAGARGQLVNLVGSQNADSGGNSMAPAMLVDVSARPTQITRPADVTGLVGTSTGVPSFLNQADTVMAMESVVRISNDGVPAAATYRTTHVTGATAPSAAAQAAAECQILKSADSAERFGGTSPDPTKDQVIVGNPGGAAGIFDGIPGGLTSDSEFLKTASIMKLVVAPGGSNYAAAGTITMGGFDYHTGNRSTGEMRDLRAGQCMGACLEYAHRLGAPLMLYVFSDGSLSSNGGMDTSPAGRNKNNWDSDNQSTGAAFFLIYDPTGTARAQMTNNQIGWMKADGSVDTAGSPGANSVTQLVDMVVLNYLALHGKSNDEVAVSNALAGRPKDSILGGQNNWSKYAVCPKII